MTPARSSPTLIAVKMWARAAARQFSVESRCCGLAASDWRRNRLRHRGRGATLRGNLQRGRFDPLTGKHRRGTVTAWCGKGSLSGLSRDVQPDRVRRVGVGSERGHSFAPQAASFLEKNFWLSGPRYDRVMPACDYPGALDRIIGDFRTKEARFWNSSCGSSASTTSARPRSCRGPHNPSRVVFAAAPP